MLLLLIKTCLLCVLAIIVRGSLPRYRIDQLVTINWKILLYILIFIFFIYFSTIFLLNCFF